MNYHNITHCDMLNGDGIRVTLWVAGCPHHCKNCQNPITWDSEGGIPFDSAAMDEIYDELHNDYCAGITFSGGDPFAPSNREEVALIASLIKCQFPKKNIWIYTGYTWEEIINDEVLKRFLTFVDIIVDGPYIEELRDVSLEWRGSSNQRVISVQESLKQNKIVTR